MSVVRHISRRPYRAVLLLGLLVPLLSGQAPDCDCDAPMVPTGDEPAGKNRFKLHMDDWVVKPGDTFEMVFTLENATPFIDDERYTARITPSTTDVGGPWEYPGELLDDSFMEVIDVTVASDAVGQLVSFAIEVVDPNGEDTNDEPFASNDYTVDADSIKIVEEDGLNYDIVLDGDTAHFVDWNPYELFVIAENAPDDAEYALVTIATPTETRSESIAHDEIVDGRAYSLDLPEGVTTVTAEWRVFARGIVRCGEHTPLEITTQPGGGPRGTLTFSPLIPRPAVDVTIAIELATPCETDSRYGILASASALVDADGIDIPAGETQGSMTLTRTTQGYLRFNVSTNACVNLTASHDVFFHGAGDQLFTGFAGPVTGSAGAVGMLDVQAEYVTEPVSLTTQNTAYWNVEYQETSPENFAVALSARAASYGGGGGGTFDGPGGEYEWGLQPFRTIPYDGELMGTFVLTRPDGTEETYTYSLAPK